MFANLRDLQNPLRLITVEKHYRDILQTIDSSAFEAMLERCEQIDNEGHPGKKYLNTARYLRENIIRVLYLGLDKVQGQHILDLGCGPGYFLWATRHFGHHPIGVDLPGNAVYNEMIQFLNLNRQEFRIWANQPLPNFGQKFDLITGYSVSFDKHGSKGDPWGPDQWQYLLDDLSQYLQPNGQIFLRLNFRSGNFYSQTVLKDFFTAPNGYRGTIIDGRRVRLSRSSNQ